MIVARVANHSGLSEMELFLWMQDFQFKNEFRQIRTVVANDCKEWRQYAFSSVGHNTIAFIFWTFSTPTIIVANWLNVIHSIISVLTVEVGRLHIFQFYFCLLWVLICHPMATRRIKSWRKHPWLMFIYMTTLLYVGGDEGAQRGTNWKTQCWLGGTKHNLLIIAQ